MTFKNCSFLLLFVLLVNSACQPKKEKKDPSKMTVTGEIDGLRKGTLYLQKIVDTLLVNVDSTKIDGQPSFNFKTSIATPEVFYLYLDKLDGNSLNDRILFFGEPGTIEINTLLKTFESSAKIKGSKNQELLQEYKSFMRKFDDKNLSLYQDFFSAKQKNDSNLTDSIANAMDNLLRRKYLYALNFASQHTDQNIAPYIAITEVYDANLSLLDTVADKMTESVKTSKYGKLFLELLEERHQNEDDN